MKQKFLYVITGAGVTLLFYSIILFLAINPRIQSSGEAPESYMGIAFMVIFPVCFLIGSFVSGYLVQPLLEKRSAMDFLWVSPGFYAALVFLVPTLLQARTLNRFFLFFFLLSAMIWMVASFAGTRLGVFFRDQKHKPGAVPGT
ncbi:MAG TPA: hypothetical protein P5551_06290 [Syntrophales bacterium]|nr:hypothetical protein [Syntrophales bacterium]HRT61952.1 hypothetical protein [Syntrophales bacterium]